MENITQLENDLWESADQLRANSKLNAGQYSMPVLGLIFLRHATTRFNRISAEIITTLPKRGGKTRPLTPNDFTAKRTIYLPEKSRYEYLVEASEFYDEKEKRNLSLGEAINRAMNLIEEQTPMLRGALPKSYNRFEEDLLGRLLRIFNRDALKTATGDVFGRIYEYFLNKFAMTGAQEGGEFFTPPSLVRLIVNVIEPDHGTVYDPACGSMGMGVQTGHFLEARDIQAANAITLYGQEKSETNANLARMNLAVHGLEGAIAVGNTYYEDTHNLVGKCDFVMANPPFNVDGIDPKKVENDTRLFTKKKYPGIAKKTEMVSNGNYLWMQYFYSYLNDTGRAGFVMASGATDKGGGELEIRQEIIATGAVDVIIEIRKNFFYTRAVPCALWFYDKGKSVTQRDKVLMIDARAIFRVVTRKINDFSNEQLANLTAIVWLHRGETERYIELVRDYLDKQQTAAQGVPDLVTELDAPMQTLIDGIAKAIVRWRDDAEKDQAPVTQLQADVDAWRTERAAWDAERTALWAMLAIVQAEMVDKAAMSNTEQQQAHADFAPLVPLLKELQKTTTHLVKRCGELVRVATRVLKAGKLKSWNTNTMRGVQKEMELTRDGVAAGLKRVVYWHNQVGWLQTRFPDGVYADVLGLCKVVDSVEIGANDDSLTPGRHVGAAPVQYQEDDDFGDHLSLIHLELNELNVEAERLSELIQSNLMELLP